MLELEMANDLVMALVNEVVVVATTLIVRKNALIRDIVTDEVEVTFTLG